MAKQKKWIIFILFSFIILTMTVSYALWIVLKEQNTENKITSSCINMELEGVTEEINLSNAIPLTDTDGMNTTPYTFTIKNTCTSFISYEIIFLVDSESTLDAQYVDVVLDRNQIQRLEQYESREIEGQTGYILQSGNLSQEDEITYNLRIWLDEEVTVSDPVFNTSLKGKIRVEAKISQYNPVEQGFKTLTEAMLVNEYQSTSIEDAKQQIESKQKPDFSKTAPIIDWTENHASTTTTTSATMPHPDLVGNGEDYTSKLTNENILPLIGTEYAFDSETGQYTIENTQYTDPTTLNYNGDTTYYFCSAGFNTNSSDLITPYQNYANCTTIYQIVSATSSDGTSTGSGGTSIKTMRYQMTVYLYNQSEQESDKSDRGLYDIEDDHGTSYYYRGSVTNNYVKFAGYYWRIIRQNGDGSVRILYAGTTPNATGSGLQIKTSTFNSTRTNPGYVGYMYGSTFNTSYEQTHANENDSKIKTELDNWYKTNIEDKGLSEYLADTGFCNDRSLDSGDGVSTTAHTYFKGYRRYVNHEPSLICPQQNDLFTVENENGNQALNYPIGLITVDELMLGGLVDGYLNRLSYTYSSAHYWTMSPSFFHTSSTFAYEFIALSSGYAHYWGHVASVYGVRPVINLASNVEIESGIGTANDPFVVKVA